MIANLWSRSRSAIYVWIAIEIAINRDLKVHEYRDRDLDFRDRTNSLRDFEFRSTKSRNWNGQDFSGWDQSNRLLIQKFLSDGTRTTQMTFLLQWFKTKSRMTIQIQILNVEVNEIKLDSSQYVNFHWIETFISKVCQHC